MEKALSDSPAEARAASFVEHLRLVHLTLLAACLAAMIAVTSVGPSYLDRSAEEVKQLLDIKNQWQNGDWLRKAFADTKSQVLSVGGVAAFTQPFLDYKSTSRNYLFALPGPGHVRFGARLPDGGERDWLVFATTAGNDARALSDEGLKFETVGDAEMIWNELDRYRYAVLLKDHGDGWRWDETGSSDQLTFSSEMTEDAVLKAGRRFGSLNFYLRADLLAHLRTPEEVSQNSTAAAQAIERDDSRCYLYGADLLRSRYVLRGVCASVPIDLQLRITQALLPPRPGQGDFAHSFPNINDLAKHLSGLSLGDLQLFIASEQNRSGEKVEILGAKLPQNAVAFWGSILLLVVTAYFWVVLRDFASQGDGGGKDSTVAWIGISKNIVSRIAFLVSLLFPFGTGVILAWNGMSSATSIYARFLYGLTVLAITAFLAIIALLHQKISAPSHRPGL
jgi:hypothetical protein